MDLEDASFSGAAPIPFCRFLHPSIRNLSVRPSPLQHCEPQPLFEYRGHLSQLNREIYKELFLFPPNYRQEKWQAAELFCCLIGHSVLSKIQPFTWRAVNPFWKAWPWLCWTRWDPKKTKKVTGLLPNSLHELDSGLCIQKLSFVGSQKYYRAASP